MIVREEERILPPSDSDPKDGVTAAHLQKMLMDLSIAHANELGAGWSDLQKLGVFWVVSRFRLRFLRPLRRGTKVFLRTWPNRADVSGVDRNFQVRDEYGVLSAEAMCRWVIVRTADGKPVKASDFPLLDSSGDYLSDRVWGAGCGDFPVPSGEDDRRLNRIVLPEDIDENHHVNNVRYVAFAEEAAAVLYPGRPPRREFGIRYLAPVFAGERLELRFHSADGILGCEGTLVRDRITVKAFRCRIE